MTLAALRDRIRLRAVAEAGRSPGGVEAPVAGDLPSATLCRRCRRTVIVWIEDVIPVEASPRPSPEAAFALPAGETERRWVEAGALVHVQHTCAWAPRGPDPVEVPSWSAKETRRSEEFDRRYREGR